MKDVQSLFGPILERAHEDPEVALIFLREMWPVLLGPDLAAKCSPDKLRRKTLRVRVPDARWRKEIETLERQILGRVQRFWGRRWIERIDFFVHP